MKRRWVALVVAALLFLGGCGENGGGPTVVESYPASDGAALLESGDAATMVVTRDYEELSDGTWRTGENVYRLRLELTGVWPGTERKGAFLVLSNGEDVTFEEALRDVTGLERRDRLPPERAVVVAHQMQGMVTALLAEADISEARLIGGGANVPAEAAAYPEVLGRYWYEPVNLVIPRPGGRRYVLSGGDWSVSARESRPDLLLCRAAGERFYFRAVKREADPDIYQALGDWSAAARAAGAVSDGPRNAAETG